MVDRLTKQLRKLSSRERRVADAVIDQLIRGNTRGLRVKKLRGTHDVFRARKGRLRVIFRFDGKKVIVLDVSLRSDTTYRKY